MQRIATMVLGIPALLLLLAGSVIASLPFRWAKLAGLRCADRAWRMLGRERLRM